MGKINNLEIYTEKIQTDNIRLMIGSDFHITKEEKYDDGTKNLFKIINSSKIDYDNLDCIIIPGDLVNDVMELRDTTFKKFFLEILKEFTKEIPTFISYGNHDMMTKDNQGNWSIGDKEILRETLSNLTNVQIVENGRRIDFYDLSFSAFSPDFEYYEDKREDMDYYFEKYSLCPKSNFDPNRYNIFLTHEPQSIIKISKELNRCMHPNTDLVISGHMHNGLLPSCLKKVKVIKNKGLISPQMELLPQFAQGEYKINNTDFIINGPINTRVETPIINNIYGANATILTLKKIKKY